MTHAINNSVATEVKRNIEMRRDRHDVGFALNYVKQEDIDTMKTMRKIAASEAQWRATAASLGLSELPTYHKTEVVKSKATIKKQFNKLHGSYVSASKRNERMIKAFIYRMKLEDELNIKPIDNPFAPKDTTYPIKITGYEYRKPYIIISAIKADDEHDRLTQTRSLDETSEFYFTFDVTPRMSRKGQLVENPELIRLRKWMWNKVDHSKPGVGFGEMLQQMIGCIAHISIVEGSEDYIGYPTYDVNERLGDTFNRNDKDYIGSYMNVHISKRQISEMSGELRLIKTSTSVDVYFGDVLIHSIKVYGSES